MANMPSRFPHGAHAPCLGGISAIHVNPFCVHLQPDLLRLLTDVLFMVAANKCHCSYWPLCLLF